MGRLDLFKIYKDGDALRRKLAMATGLAMHKRFEEQIFKTNMRYKTIAMYVDVFILTEENRHSNESWPQWMHEAWAKDAREIGAVSNGGESLILQCSESSSTEIRTGQCVMRHDDGVLSPITQEILNKTYVPCVEPGTVISVDTLQMELRMLREFVYNLEPQPLCEIASSTNLVVVAVNSEAVRFIDKITDEVNGQ